MVKVLSKLLKIIKWIFICFVGIIALFIISILITRGIKQEKYKIIGGNTVCESEYIIIGGVEQFIQIRGKNKENPIILYLHGGPGNPIPFLSYYYQEYLLNDFTFVSWDQRGSGRTYYRNQRDNENITIDILLQNLDELIQYLKTRFNQEQVIIMGHSWGTILGISYINLHPENVSQYIGISQCVDFNEGKLYSGRKALEIAAKKNQNKDIAELERLLIECAKHKNFSSLNIDNHVNLVNLTLKYLKAEKELPGKELWETITSPDLEFKDLQWLISAMTDYNNFFSILSPSMDYMFKFNAYECLMESNVPMAFIMGSSDWITPMEIAMDYYTRLENENKFFFIMNGMGHTPFIDNPKQFSANVIYILNTANKDILRK